jgi:transcriptional regulator with XRE-family HTH domain
LLTLLRIIVKILNMIEVAGALPIPEADDRRPYSVVVATGLPHAGYQQLLEGPGHAAELEEPAWASAGGSSAGNGGELPPKSGGGFAEDDDADDNPQGTPSGEPLADKLRKIAEDPRAVRGYVDLPRTAAPPEEQPPTDHESAATERPAAVAGETRVTEDALKAELSRLTTEILNEIAWFQRGHGILKEDIAERLGVPPGRVSQTLSNGENLTLPDMAAISRALAGHFEVKFVPDSDRLSPDAAGESPAREDEA